MLTCFCFRLREGELKSTPVFCDRRGELEKDNIWKHADCRTSDIGSLDKFNFSFF